MKLGTILRRNGVLTEEQLDQALRHQQQHRGRLGEALLTLGLCSEAQLSHALAIQMGMPFVDLAETPPTPWALLQLSPQLARHYRVVPVRQEEDRSLLVVAQNPHDFTIDDSLRRVLRRPVVLACGVRSQIDEILDRYTEYADGNPRVGHEGAVRERLDARAELQTLLKMNPSEGLVRLRRLMEEEVQHGGRIRFELDRSSLRIQVDHRGTLLTVATLPPDLLQVGIHEQRGAPASVAARSPRQHP